MQKPSHSPQWKLYLQFINPLKKDEDICNKLTTEQKNGVLITPSILQALELPWKQVQIGLC